MATVGVLGAGISGLAFAAHYKDSFILEREPVPGGLCRSVHFDKYTFDLGSHIAFTKDNEVRSFFLSVLEKNVLTHKRNTKVYYKGKLIHYPFENGLFGLDLQERYECAERYIDAYMKREKGDAPYPKNFAEWMYYRFGSKITDIYLLPYNRKIWNCEPANMDFAWVEGRVPQPSVSDILKSSMGIASEGYVEQLNFNYPLNGGFQALTDSIAAAIGNERIAYNFEATALKKNDSKWLVSNGKKEYEFKKIVSTINLRDLLSILPDVPTEVQKAADLLRWNSIHLTMVGLHPSAKKNNIHWLYVPEESFLPNRISFPSNMSMNNAPEKHFSILAETTIRPDSPDKKRDVTEEIVADLESMSFLSKKDVAVAKTITMDYAYPVYDLSHAKNTKIIYDYLESLGGIYLVGRFSEFKYYNTDKCTRNAINLANRLISEQSEPPRFTGGTGQN